MPRLPPTPRVGPARTSPTRAVLATVPMLGAVVVMLVLALSGVLGPFEEVARLSTVSVWAHADIEPHALIIEMDEAVEAELGPPPYTPAQWRQIAAALANSGLYQVDIVEPAGRMIRDPGGPSAPLASTLRVHAPGHDPSPLVRAPWVLPLPRVGGRLLGLGHAAGGPRSAWCHWARCPTGASSTLPLFASEAMRIPRVPLSEILFGDARVRVSPTTPILLGPTDSVHATLLPVGARGDRLSLTETAALGISTLRSRSSRPELPPLLLIPALALLVLAGALIAHLEPILPAEAWVVALPALVGGLCVALDLVGVLQAPSVLIALGGLLGPLTEALRLRSRMSHFLDRVAERLVLTEEGLDPEDQPTPEGMLQRLASLTWNHLPTERMVYVHLEQGRPRVVGGFGLEVSALRLPSTVSGMDALAEQARCDAVVPSETSATLVAVRREGRPIGWWLVAWESDELAPDRRRVHELARWVAEHTTPRPVADPHALLLRLDAHLDALESALERTARAGQRRRTLLRTADLPLCFVDRAGSIVFQNEAFEGFFAAEPSLPRSLRELAFRAWGPEGLSQRMRLLFDEGKRLSSPWNDRRAVLHASPAGDDARSGVLVWIEVDEGRGSRTIAA